jgi:hypothetical protein
MMLALYSALVLTLPACGGVEEIWVPETVVEEEPVEPVRSTETKAGAHTQLTLTRKVRARETAVERLHLRHTESSSDMSFDNFGLVFFSVLGGILTVGLYFAVAFLLVPADEDE